MAEVDDAVYVYGVSQHSEGLGSLSGVDGMEVETVEHDGLVALTSRLHQAELSARDLRAHWRVLSKVFEHATVLPARFGTVMENRDAVRDQLLAPNADRLSGLLTELDGLVQLNVTARYNEEVLLREVVSRSRRVATLRRHLRSSPQGGTPAEKFQLGQLVEAEIGRIRATDTDTALRSLEPLAVSSRAEEVSHPSAFSLAFLVARKGEPPFSDGVGRLREQLGERVELNYVGPLPPFSFADTRLTTGSEPWG